MKMTKKIRIVWLFIIVSLIGLIANYLVRATSIASFSFFEPRSLFTYFGVLIGFALTIYTFGLTMVSDIKTKIDNHKKFSDIQKNEMYETLISGFGEIKGDVWLIFYSLLIVIGFAIAKEIVNPFGWQIENLMLPESVNLTLFITTTIAMWDIMQTLFNLAEINLELNKNNKASS